MPRTADPGIRNTILETAEELLEAGSVEAVTMRAIAEKTGIAVTTIYERFGSREGVIRALTAHFAEDEAVRLSCWQEIEEVFEHYLAYAEEHPHRYKLIADSFMNRFAAGKPIPGFELVKNRLARKFGGSPDQHVELALGVLELLAGTVTAILTSASREYQIQVKRAAIAGLRLMLAGVEVKNNRS